LSFLQGPYSVTLRGSGPHDELLFCVVIDFRVVPAPPPGATDNGGLDVLPSAS
jgi:hypothetical protein